MADEPEPPPLDPRAVDLMLKALARGVPLVGIDEPIDRPPVVTGKDAALMRETARQMVDERLKERHLLSEMEIKGVAKEIAHAIVEKAVGGIRNDLRTEEQIEGIALDVCNTRLRAVGIRADDEHIDETRDTLMGLQRNHKRRIELTGEAIKETIKAIAAYGSAAILGALGVWFVTKGGSPH